MKNRVVITGIGIVSPIGTGINSFKNALFQGHSGIKFIDELANLNFACQVGGIPEISSSPFINIINNNELAEADTAIKYAVLAGIEAWSSAGFKIPSNNSVLTNNNTGAIIGSCYTGTEIFVRKMYPLICNGNVKKLGSQIVEHWMPSGSAAALSKILALSNQTTSNSSACSTSIESIIMAYERIQSKKAKVMLAGGTDPYSPYAWAGFDSMRLLCRKFNENPKSASRPMSNSAAGFVPSSGAGVLIIEEYEHAKSRKANILAEIIGTAINSGGQRNGGSMTSPNSLQVINCITKALNQANISGEDISLISGHLTGTMADSIEVSNWAKALNLKDNFPYINAPKSMLGHMIGAAGAVETIAAVLQLHEDFVHPSINCEDLHPEIKKIWDQNKIPHNIIHNAGLKYIAKAGFGFGDVNSCLILKKFE
ncbi:MAG TPA: beta-ketoacyl-[acyl-carrier-protein] synthase family protein [Bacteroidales bacterium]|nr:beta-ketoacyl-[acyl-carrier-protein] synthase family protein [Bacteroidales bacterium]